MSQLRKPAEVAVFPDGTQVQFQIAGKTFTLPWQLANEIARRLRLATRAAHQFLDPSPEGQTLITPETDVIDGTNPAVRVYSEASHVHLQIGGLTIEIPTNLGTTLVAHLRNAAQAAEQQEKPEVFIHNQAFAIALGFPWQTLTDTAMAEQAIRDSTDLRRHLGMRSVTTKPGIGRPRIFQGAPPS